MVEMQLRPMHYSTDLSPILEQQNPPPEASELHKLADLLIMSL